MKNRIKIGDKDYRVSKRTKQISKDERHANKRRPALVEAKQIYESWKREFCATPCLPNQIAGRILAMRDVMARKINNRAVRMQVLDMIELVYRAAIANHGQPESTVKCGKCGCDFVPANGATDCDTCLIFGQAEEGEGAK